MECRQSLARCRPSGRSQPLPALPRCTRLRPRLPRLLPRLLLRLLPPLVVVVVLEQCQEGEEGRWEDEEQQGQG